MKRIPAFAAAAAIAAAITACGSASGITPAGNPAPAATPPPLTYTCTTGWTPQLFGNGVSSQPFHRGPEPAWAAPAPGGGYEIQAWLITVANTTSQPVRLGPVTVIYYTGGGVEMGSDTADLGGEVLTSHQAVTVAGNPNIQPDRITNALSCQVIADPAAILGAGG